MKAMQWENHKTKGTNPVKANLNIYSQKKQNESRIKKPSRIASHSCDESTRTMIADISFFLCDEVSDYHHEASTIVIDNRVCDCHLTY